MENFKEGSPNLVIVIALFIVATFLTQITILNMLIAIMGDTFGKVTEIKEQAGLKEKINILADFVWLIPNEKVEFRYVYSMKPRTQTEEESNGWEGTVSTIKKVIATSNQIVKNSTGRQMEIVKTEVTATQ